MVDILRNFSSSNYRFTDPIRFFKANDPIYFEVDNIPLKQLQENDLWLKDQIFGLSISTQGLVKRNEISELIPIANNFDNVVTVKPGRFTARINDAYNKDPLAFIETVLEDIPGITNPYLRTFKVLKTANSEALAIINKFKENVRLDLNGLYERAFSRAAGQRVNTVSPIYSDSSISLNPSIVGLDDQNSRMPTYPGIGIKLWSVNNSTGAPDYYVIRQKSTAPAIGFVPTQQINLNFVRKFRGVARTAVVDVPEDLTIEIPRFDSQDHFYYNSNGQKELLNASHRIDLLFIYSKPVDSETATIAKFSNQTPTTINRAELGLLYGAGVGINYQDVGNPEYERYLTPAGVPNEGWPSEEDSSTLVDGTPKMMSHFGDETGNYSGFKVSGNFIRGSFPAPDDLLNINGSLDIDLDSSSFNLIGQTILPIAYIVSRRNSNSNVDGVNIITDNDVIDIRPFFRTTELTYDERSGLAAAIPAPSLANPVATQNHVAEQILIAESVTDSKLNYMSGVIDSLEFVSNTQKTIYLNAPFALSPFLRLTKANFGSLRNQKVWTIPDSGDIQNNSGRSSSFGSRPYLTDPMRRAFGTNYQKITHAIIQLTVHDWAETDTGGEVRSPIVWAGPGTGSYPSFNNISENDVMEILEYCINSRIPYKDAFAVIKGRPWVSGDVDLEPLFNSAVSRGFFPRFLNTTTKIQHAWPVTRRTVYAKEVIPISTLTQGLVSTKIFRTALQHEYSGGRNATASLCLVGAVLVDDRDFSYYSQNPFIG